VLDLDETLVHCETQEFENYETVISFELQESERNLGQQTMQVFASFRPLLIQFLEEVCKVFEVVLFTASGVSFSFFSFYILVKVR